MGLLGASLRDPLPEPALHYFSIGRAPTFRKLRLFALSFPIPPPSFHNYRHHHRTSSGVSLLRLRPLSWHFASLPNILELVSTGGPGDPGAKHAASSNKSHRHQSSGAALSLRVCLSLRKRSSHCRGQTPTSPWLCKCATHVGDFPMRRGS